MTTSGETIKTLFKPSKVSRRLLLNLTRFKAPIVPITVAISELKRRERKFEQQSELDDCQQITF